MRLFLALWPDPPLAAELARRGEALAQRTGGRPIPAERIHLTVAFLGEQDDERAAVSAAGSVDPPGAIELCLDELGVFPGASVLWTGPTQTPQALMVLNAQLRAALAELAVPLSGGFRPHVTLVRGIRRPAAVGDTPAESEPLDWRAERLVLVESRSGLRGPEYRTRQRWPLSPRNP